MRFQDVGDAGTCTLAASPHLAWPRRLGFGSNPLGEAGPRALAASPSLASLRWLDLCGCPIDPCAKPNL